MCSILLLPGCSNEKAWEKPIEETGVAKGSIAETKSDETDHWREIKLTENYSYWLPDYSEEITNFDSTDGFIDEKRFLLNNDDIEVRSFVITDEEDVFPGLVEALYNDDKNAEISYRSFFDTAVASGDDVVYDAEGNVIYRRAYFWPDGGNVLCSLSVISYSAEDAKVAGEDLLKMVRNTDSDNDVYQIEVIPPNAEELHTPSQEEIDQALMYDVQESMQEYEFDDEYVDYDSSLGKRGR